MERVLPEARDITELLQQLFYFFPYLKQGANLMEAIEVYKQVHVRILLGCSPGFCIQKDSTLTASREHKLIKDLPGFWSFPGVKLTAGRAAGYEAALEAWNFLRKGVPVPAVTWDSLPGGELWDYDRFARDAERRFKLGSAFRCSDSISSCQCMAHVMWKFSNGRNANRIFSDPLLPDEPWILAQAAYAVHEEMITDSQ